MGKSGRIYDPLIGRFMSAYPIIQAADNLQSYNRYTYVLNNPLAFTDPSGYSWFGKLFKKIFKPILAIAVAYFAPYYAPSFYAATATSLGVSATVANGFLGGALAGAIKGGNFKSALLGGFTGALFGGAGLVGDPTDGVRYIAHFGAGCVSSVAGGGGCATGGVSATFGRFATNETSNWGVGVAQGTAAAVAGSVGSVITGGNYWNGATTAAYGYMFNQLLSKVEAERLADERNRQVLQGRGCVAEAARACAGLSDDTQLSQKGKELVIESIKLAVSMHPVGRSVVGVADGGSVVIDTIRGNYKDAGVTTSSIVVGAGVEKGLESRGVPSFAAGRVGTAAGAAWDRLVKFITE